MNQKEYKTRKLVTRANRLLCSSGCWMDIQHYTSPEKWQLYRQKLGAFTPPETLVEGELKDINNFLKPLIKRLRKIHYNR